MVRELITHEFAQPIHPWTRGVDRTTFYPSSQEYTSPKIILCVSRVSHEKGLDDFCALDVGPAQKVLVGDGPYLNALKSKYPDVLFVGKRTGRELGDWYRKAAVFVFPSRSDTFGVVNIEALACGTPVAAYPVTGPVDIIEHGVNGYISEDLGEAVRQCLTLDRQVVASTAERWTWESCYEQFTSILIPAK
jgi:glycosyltransferase involved in cell wall biosynthesis